MLEDSDQKVINRARQLREESRRLLEQAKQANQDLEDMQLVSEERRLNSKKDSQDESSN